jgi:hypothetical protein
MTNEIQTADNADAIPVDAATDFKWNNRYIVGQKYPFICVVFESKDSNRFYIGPYCPWLHTNLQMKVIVLECKSRHAVSEGYDPSERKKYTGFIFTDADGHVWHNQYPHASYGQLDDSNDRRVHPEGWRADGKWHEPFDGTPFSFQEHLVMFEDAMSFVANIEKALLRDAAGKAGEDSFLAKSIFEGDQADQLRTYQREVVAAIEEVSGGLKVKYRSLTFKYTDGREPKTIPLMPIAYLE